MVGTQAGKEAVRSGGRASPYRLPQSRGLPPHPMCFLGCLMQKGELMVLAVTLWLPSPAVTSKGTHCLGKLPWLPELCMH